MFDNGSCENHIEATVPGMEFVGRRVDDFYLALELVPGVPGPAVDLADLLRRRARGPARLPL